MKWGTIFLGLAVLLLASLLWARESFTNPDVLAPTKGDKALESKIKAMGPSGVNVDAYISQLSTFYENVYKTSPMEPTEQQVDAYLNGIESSINPNDKGPLKAIILDWFNIRRSGSAAEREAQQMTFEPSVSALQDSMAAAEGDRTEAETTVGNTVMTQLAQMNPLGRGGKGEVYGLDAYNQDTPLSYNPTLRQQASGGPGGTPFITVQSGLADVPVKTQEIYGPRVPKDGRGSRNPRATAPPDPSKAYPLLLGPDAAPRKGALDRQATPLSGNNALQGTNLGSTLPAKSVGLPLVTLPNTVEVEPIPVLADFSNILG